MTHDQTTILVSAALIGWLGFQWAGKRHFRDASHARYALFLVAAALWFAAIPAILGDWLWSLVFLLAGLVEVYFRLRARRRDATSRMPVV